jgi:ribosomal-protein-alanine N-acetyltransferase
VSAPAVTEISTERLLRPMLLEDAEPFAAIVADPEALRFIGDGTTGTLEETVEWVERSIRRNAFGGFDKRTVVAEDGSVAGWCGIGVWTIEGVVERELGYVLAREHWGGYATEAASAMRDHALTTLGVRRLIALIHPHNHASKRVAGKLGFTYERMAPFHGRTVELWALET